MPTRLKSRKGQSLIEVMALLAACLPIALLVIDGTMYLSALGLNDSACQAVVRTVSAGCPSAIQKDSAETNARAALELFGLDHGFIHLRKQCVIVEQLSQPLPSAPFGGAVNGEVTVHTTAYVMLPFWCNVMRSGPIAVEAHHTSAYRWSMPSIAASRS